MEQLLHSLVKFLQCADRLSAQSAEFRGIDPITVSEHFFPLLVCGHTHINAVILTFVCGQQPTAKRPWACNCPVIVTDSSSDL